MVSIFTMLFVCTGNVCRSPMAQLLTESELHRRFGADAEAFQLRGAGTGTRCGYPISPHSVAVLTEYGVPADRSERYAATEISPELVGAADLVLTADRGHRGAVIELEPAALKRSFTLLEFARVAPGVARELQVPADLTERARLVVAETARQRAGVPAEQPNVDDIPDPIGESVEVFQTVGRRIAETVDDSLTALVGFPVSGAEGTARRARGA